MTVPGEMEKASPSRPVAKKARHNPSLSIPASADGGASSRGGTNDAAPVPTRRPTLSPDRSGGGAPGALA